MIPEERPLNIFNEDGEVEFFATEPRSIDPFEDLKTLYKGHSDAVLALEIDHQDKRLYTASWDNEVLIWNPHTRTKIGVLPHGSWVNDVKVVRLVAVERERRQSTNVAISLGNSSAKSALSGTGGSGGVAPEMSGTFDQFLSSLMPTTKFVATACEDGFVTLWDPTELTVVFQLAPGYGCITKLATAGDLLFAASMWTVYAISLSSGTVVREYTDHSDVNCMGTHDEHLYCGLQDGRILCWDVVGAFVLREMKGHGPDGGVRDLIIHAPSNSLFSCGDDGRVKFWALSTGSCVRAVHIGPKPVRCLALHTGGSAPERFLYAGVMDGSIRCIRVSNYQMATARSFLCNCLTIYDDNTNAHLIGGDQSGVVQSFTLRATEAKAVQMQV